MGVAGGAPKWPRGGYGQPQKLLFFNFFKKHLIGIDMVFPLTFGRNFNRNTILVFMKTTVTSCDKNETLRRKKIKC
jgi:hypothetical protein